MKRMQWLVVGIIMLAFVSTLVFTTVSFAHNAAHIHLPNGTCQDLGSGKHAPTENQDKLPNQQGDQYGARWAAEHGYKIYPRHCDETDHVGE